jgi:hypothetical protein
MHRIASEPTKNTLFRRFGLLLVFMKQILVSLEQILVNLEQILVNLILLLVSLKQILVSFMPVKAHFSNPLKPSCHHSIL